MSLKAKIAILYPLKSAPVGIFSVLKHFRQNFQ